MKIFFSSICCKILICLYEKTNNKQKEAEDGPYLKKGQEPIRFSLKLLGRSSSSSSKHKQNCFLKRLKQSTLIGLKRLNDTTKPNPAHGSAVKR